MNLNMRTDLMNSKFNGAILDFVPMHIRNADNQPLGPEDNIKCRAKSTYTITNTLERYTAS